MTIRDYAANAAQSLGTDLPAMPLVELMGSRRVLIENHKGLLAYSEEEICVKTKIGLIRVAGEALFVNKMTACSLVICGKISSVSFVERG